MIIWKLLPFVLLEATITWLIHKRDHVLQKKIFEGKQGLAEVAKLGNKAKYNKQINNNKAVLNLYDGISCFFVSVH